MGDPSDGGNETYRRERETHRERVYAALCDARCRTVLAVLNRDGPTPLEELAVAVRAEERDIGVDTVSGADAELQELYHVSLPRLEAAGLVSREDDVISASLDGHEAVPDVRAFLETGRQHAASSLRHLTFPERRAALVVVSTADEPMRLSTLTAEMRRLDGFDAGDDPDDALPVALHHLHLPLLDRAGLLRYAPDRKLVRPAEPASTDEGTTEAESSPHD
jgi:hypothetical protein